MGEVLLENVNPNGNIQAVVETDGRVCYFYLFGTPETQLGMKALWLCNLISAPKDLDVASMKAGRPPLNPLQNCRHPNGRPVPKVEDLRVLWLPEGNGAAIYERREILGIIPPWSGTKGFHGYARENIGEGPVAWELNSSNVLHERFEEAQQYWDRWDDDGFWPSNQSQLLSQVEAAFGPHSNYYAIDGGEWPPKALVRFSMKDRTVLVTIGISLRPQPNVEGTDSEEHFRRIEIGAVLPATWSESAIKAYGGYLSGQSKLPWSYYTWLGEGHTVPCDSWQNKEFRFALLTTEHGAAPRLSLGPVLGDMVPVLWFIPIGEAERDLAMKSGSETLRSRFVATRWTKS